MKPLEFLADNEDVGKRADVFVKDRLCELLEREVSRSFVQGLFEKELVLIDGKAAVKKHLLKSSHTVAVSLPDMSEPEALPQDIPLDVVYEDDSLIVVNKPRGMVVHPAPGNPDGTLVNALLYHCGESLSGINGVFRPGIVHRIDKDTSGLLLVAKNDFAHVALAKQLAEHTIDREYRAVVHGSIDEAGFVDAPIGRSTVDRMKYCVTDKGSKSAYTTYSPLKKYDGFTLISCVLRTGRTHQIRVHMSYIGHPVAGDPVYAPKNTPNIGGQCLHAAVLGFTHPVSGQRLRFTADYPEYFTRFISTLRGRDE